MAQVLVSLAVALALPLAALGMDLERKINFNIPAQDLSAALLQFSQQARIQIIVSGDIRGEETKGVTGQRAIKQALSEILGPAGLLYRVASDDSITVARAADGNAETTGARNDTALLRLAQGNNGRDSAGGDDNQAGAASRPASDKGGGVEEIVVTAQKRAQRILDVPLAISAFTNDALRERGAVQLSDFLQSAPSVGIVDSESGTNRVNIRGISASAGDSTVGYYLDELPFSFIGSVSLPDVRTFDLERVEVLRGPQGTLYGDGSLGGTIRVLTADPNLRQLQGDVDVSAMSTADGEDSYAAKGMLNLPLKEDMLGLRLVASHEDFGGWIDDTLTGTKDENGRVIDNYRAKLRLAPNEKLDLVLSAWHTETDFVDSTVSLDNRTTPAGRTDAEFKYDLYSLVLRYHLGFADLVSATSWMDLSLVNRGMFAGFPQIGAQKQEVRSEELRLTSADEGRFHWTAGLFYRTMERPLTSQILNMLIQQYSDSKSYAIFGEGTWSLNKRLDLTVGLRYFKDDRSRNDPVAPATLALIRQTNPDFSGNVDTSVDTFNPRFNLAWHVNDDWMLYTNVAKGFRSGQVQPVASLIAAALAGRTIAVGIDEETLWSYEIGSKSTFAGGRAALEAAIYYNDWRDLQLTVALASGLSGFANAGRARTLGGEVSLSVQPVEDLDLRLSASHIDAEYAESITGVNPHKGDRVSGVPENMVSASASYRWPLTSALKGVVYGSAQYTSERVDVVNVTLPSDNVTVLDTRLGVEGRSWGLYLFGDNLTDEDGAVDVRFPVLAYAAPRLRPRTYGVNMNYRFR